MDEGTGLWMIGGMIAGGVLALISCWLRLLTWSGALAGFALSVPLLGFGGYMWAMPMITFFVLSSLLSKAGRSIKKNCDLTFEKGSRRDAAQVLANGGVAGIMAVTYTMTGWIELYPFFCTALAIAAADTWATELGTLSQTTPRRVTNGQKVPTGTSGGITIMGLISAVIGAFTVALSGWAFYGGWPMVAQITCYGLLGSLLDSFLGATVQVQYSCVVCSKQTERMEHCNRPTDLVSGWMWMNNDWVNFLSITGGTIIAGVIGWVQ